MCPKRDRNNGKRNCESRGFNRESDGPNYECCKVDRQSREDDCKSRKLNWKSHEVRRRNRELSSKWDRPSSRGRSAPATNRDCAGEFRKIQALTPTAPPHLRPFRFSAFQVFSLSAFLFCHRGNGTAYVPSCGVDSSGAKF